MHSHLELIIPSTTDIKGSVETVLAPFSEDTNNSHAFWDWYEIGGRWSGLKLKNAKPGDICTISQIPTELSCKLLIVALDNGPFDSGLSAVFMLQTEYWNGCNFQDTNYSGNVLEGLAAFYEWSKPRGKHLPAPDDICVTIDCHC